MFPSNNNGNYNDPFPDIDPFVHFPSPYYNQCEIELEDIDVFLNRHTLLHQQTLTVTGHSSVSDTIINMPNSSKNDESTTERCAKTSNNDGTTECVHHQVVRKRSFSKKDRHSKINTAKGPRDRRMRLSLDVAREFFGLQDLLSFDKASKTIEWLLIQAKQEIENLKQSRSFVAGGANYSLSSTSEGEVVSGVDNKAAISSKGKPSKKGKTIRQPRKTGFGPLTKDLREKARARARARTSAKIMCTQRNNPSLQTVEAAEVKEFGSRPDDELMRIIRGVMIDDSSEIKNRWSSNSMFSCLQNDGTNQVQEHHTLWQIMGGLNQ